MKKLFVLFSVLFFVACQPKEQRVATGKAQVIKVDSVDSLKQQLADTPAITPADPIVAIRQKVEQINNGKLEPKHIEFMCDEKMKVDQFYKSGEIVKISVDFGTVGDVYAREDYYYDKGKLIFKYEFVEGGPACEGCIKKNEYRSYIRNGEVIKYMKDKNVAECRTCSFAKTAKENKLLNATTPAEVKAVLCR